jgi:4-amino-4-deoxy-L-arabinose transferase-like glycosyltransferase
VVYFWNLGYNDIWNPNEGFYADATREMFIRNDFFTFFFNDELRFNKPPVTYWSIALFVPILGINEFSIRFPMALMSLLTIWITYLTGKKLYDKNTGVFAGMMMALSLQFTVNARYSSPEIPLTFFFSLTMYWFLLAYRDRSAFYTVLAYLAFGFTMLCKGFPYLIIIGLIILLYLVIDNDYDWKQTWKAFLKLNPFLGIPLVVLIGLSWPVYMYYLHGEAFLSVLNDETVDRAFSREMYNLLRGIFYYPEAISWGFLPYSMVFFFSFGYFIRKKITVKRHAFSFSWIIVMLVIFTASSGKLPTYFLQAHTPMAILAAAFLVNRNPSLKWEKWLWYFMLWLPGFLITALGLFLTYLLSLSPVFYLVALLPLLLWLYNFAPGGSRFFKRILGNDSTAFSYLKYFPFYALISTMLVFAGGVMVKLETFRPFDEIGAIIKEEAIPTEIPLHIDEMKFYNLPYYAERKNVVWSNPEAVARDARNGKTTLALMRTSNLDKLEEEKVLWQGWIYDNTSEAKFSKFVIGYLKASRGDYTQHAHFSLVRIN